MKIKLEDMLATENRYSSDLDRLLQFEEESRR